MLQLKIRPGQRIAIGDGVVLDVVLDDNRKLALNVSAPGLPIVRSRPSDADIPLQSQPQTQI